MDVGLPVRRLFWSSCAQQHQGILPDTWRCCLLSASSLTSFCAATSLMMIVTAAVHQQLPSKAASRWKPERSTVVRLRCGPGTATLCCLSFVLDRGFEERRLLTRCFDWLVYGRLRGRCTTAV